MGIFAKRLIFFIFLLVFSTLFFKNTYSSEKKLNAARYEFLIGNYKKSINIAKNLVSSDSKVFYSRALSIYSHFFLDGEVAKENFLKAYEIAIKASINDPKNAELYVEAAHALGRYGQQIGILSAISEGIAERVKSYLDKALLIDQNNIIANLSLGMWHAEIINKTGKTLAKAIYKADIKKAREYFLKAYKISNKEIGILYELSYGYYLLGTEKDLQVSRKYINKLILKKNLAHIDERYKQKALSLKKQM